MKFLFSILLLTFSSATSTLATAVDGCRLKKVDGVRNEFKIDLSDVKTIQKACPFKRIFSEVECGCVLPPEPPTTPAPSTTTATLTTTPSNIPPPHCNFRPNPDDPFSYLQMTNDGERVRPCSNGTIFQLNPSCNCVHWDLIDPLCLADVTLSVTDNKVHGQGNGFIVPVLTENMNITNNELVFNGNSDILLNTFDDTDYTNGLTIALQFQESPDIKRREILLTNCDKNRYGHSFEIAVTAYHVEFTVDVGKKSFYQTNIEYKRGPAYKKVVAIYDGKRLQAFVDNNIGTLLQSGTIQKRARPVLIGNTECPGSFGFNGKMKGISIYRCVKSGLTGRRY